MAYYSKNGSGIDSSAYIYVQLQVTHTDYPTYSHFSVKSVAVSDTGTSSFIRGQVTTNQGGTSWTAATGWKDVSYNGTTTLATATFDVTRGASDKRSEERRVDGGSRSRVRRVPRKVLRPHPVEVAVVRGDTVVGEAGGGIAHGCHLHPRAAIGLSLDEGALARLRGVGRAVRP